MYNHLLQSTGEGGLIPLMYPASLYGATTGGETPAASILHQIQLGQQQSGLVLGPTSLVGLPQHQQQQLATIGSTNIISGSPTASYQASQHAFVQRVASNPGGGPTAAALLGAAGSTQVVDTATASPASVVGPLPLMTVPTTGGTSANPDSQYVINLQQHQQQQAPLQQLPIHLADLQLHQQQQQVLQQQQFLMSYGGLQIDQQQQQQQAPMMSKRQQQQLQQQQQLAQLQLQQQQQQQQPYQLILELPKQQQQQQRQQEQQQGFTFAGQQLQVQQPSLLQQRSVQQIQQPSLPQQRSVQQIQRAQQAPPTQYSHQLWVHVQQQQTTPSSAFLLQRKQQGQQSREDHHQQQQRQGQLIPQTEWQQELQQQPQQWLHPSGQAQQSPQLPQQQTLTWQQDQAHARVQMQQQQIQSQQQHQKQQQQLALQQTPQQQLLNQHAPPQPQSASQLQRGSHRAASTTPAIQQAAGRHFSDATPLQPTLPTSVGGTTRVVTVGTVDTKAPSGTGVIGHPTAPQQPSSTATGRGKVAGAASGVVAAATGDMGPAGSSTGGGLPAQQQQPQQQLNQPQQQPQQRQGAASAQQAEEEGSPSTYRALIDWRLTFTSTVMPYEVLPPGHPSKGVEGLQELRLGALEVLLAETPDAANAAVEVLLSRMWDGVVAMDMEWKPDTARGDSNPVALLQLSSAGLVVVVRTLACGLPEAFRRGLMEDSDIELVVAGWTTNDERKFEESFGLQTFWCRITDIQKVAKACGHSKTGVRALVQAVLEPSVGMPKSKKVTTSDWSAPTLQPEQLKYAVLDAACTEHVFRCLEARF